MVCKYLWSYLSVRYFLFEVDGVSDSSLTGCIADYSTEKGLTKYRWFYLNQLAFGVT